jgi:Family of unknown function (DUF6519)
MNGDFKTDITRDTYRKHKNFSRVLMQQGRVQLDADWNEQTDILLHYLRRLTTDIIGPHAGPSDDLGFSIGVYTPPPQKSGGKQSGSKKKGDPKAADQPDTSYKVVIGGGRYYVDGLLCENDDNDGFVYTIEDEQQTATTDGNLLFYLDVWEREVTYLEDDSIREVALNGPDTATRAEIIWQVRAQATIDHPEITPPTADQLKQLGDFVTTLTETVEDNAPDFLNRNPNKPVVGKPYLKARTLPIDEQDATNPCITPPSSQFRGEENQLYRVEVHTSGYGRLDQNQLQQLRSQGRQTEGTGTSKTSGSQTTQYATFKWSRENGSVVFPITGPVSSVGNTPASSVSGGTNTLTVTVANLGRDDSRYTLHINDWVEIVEYEDTLERQPGNLAQVTAVDYITMQVSLAAYNNSTIAFDSDRDPTKQLLLRRWDYQEMDPSDKGATKLDTDGALEIFENHWLALEDGIQVLFHHDIDQKPDSDADDLVPYYRTGNYWLIPARTATGDIEWPQRKNEHKALPPHGPRHHFAPIAFVTLNNGKLTDTKQVIDLRRKINPVWSQIIP